MSSRRVGVLTQGAVGVGFIVVETQDWAYKEGPSLNGNLQRYNRAELIAHYVLQTLRDDDIVDWSILDKESVSDLHEGVFRYAGTHFQVEWLSGAEATKVLVDHFEDL